MGDPQMMVRIYTHVLYFLCGMYTILCMLLYICICSLPAIETCRQMYLWSGGLMMALWSDGLMLV